MQLDIKAQKHVLFDLDGTISDPKTGITKAVQYALQSLGVTVEDADSLTTFIGPPLQRSFEEFYGFDSEKSTEAVRKYREYYAPTGLYENQLYPGIAPLLQLLKQQGRQIILATSKPTVFAKQILEYWGIDHYFTFIAGSELSGERVEKREVIAYALEQCGIKAEDAVMIGDRKHDILGAKALGVPCIGVLYGYGDHAELSAAGADYIVSSTAELRQILCGDAFISLAEQPLGQVVTALIEHENGNIKRIAHSLKMHGYALGIAAGEGVTEKELHLLQAAALLHDVGISEAQRRFGKSSAKLQEDLGAVLAGRFLRQLSWDEGSIERICFLIGNHHSYEVEGGLLLQIIFEADYCVNFQEGSWSAVTADDMLLRFKTDTGKKLFAAMHLTVS